MAGRPSIFSLYGRQALSEKTDLTSLGERNSQHHENPSSEAGKGRQAACSEEMLAEGDRKADDSGIVGRA